MRLRPEFVDHIPEQLCDGVLYVSMRFGTVVHRCACGCGEEVVTPLSPADWRLTYDGRTVSLAPSIGNWSFPCRSHYWIDEGLVLWARGFTEAEVAVVRQESRTRRDGYYLAEGATVLETVSRRDTQRDLSDDGWRGLWKWLWKRIRILSREWGHGGQ